MKTLPFTLLALLCSLTLLPAPAQAQTAPAEKTIDVKGSVSKELNMSPGSIYVLKEGATVQKNYEELTKNWNVARKAAAEVESLGEEPKGDDKNPGKKKWKKAKETADKKFAKQLEVYDESLKKFEESVKTNEIEKLTLDEKGRFTATVPANSYLYFSMKKEDRGYVWITKAASTVTFSNINKVPDATIKPKVEKKEK